MRIEEMGRSQRMPPLKYPLRDVPHATLETNRTCNMTCRSCYTLDKTSVKTFEQIKSEIDLVSKKRNLQAMTILGGEPTLHPRLAEVVSYIKRRGFFCQLLTNGIVFLEERGGRYLDKLVKAGLDRIIFHVDSGQSDVHRDPERARMTLFTMCERKKISFGLSVTIYNEDQGLLGGFVRKYSRFRYFCGVLSVLARDPQPPKIQSADLRTEYLSLLTNPSIEPSAFISSNISEADVRWFLYFYFINARTGKAISVSPRLDRIFRTIYRAIRGRNVFVIPMIPLLTVPVFFLAGFMEILFAPGKIANWTKMLKPSWLGTAIRLQYIAIQTPPEVIPGGEQRILCYHCPDATIRNGRLVPVCLADQVSPLRAPFELPMSPNPWSSIVADHLQENSRNS